MSLDVTILNTAFPYDGDKKIIVGNGESLVVKHISISQLPTFSHPLCLKNVLHVPMLIVNLLSVKQLCRHNHSWFIYDDVEFFVQDKATREILYQGNSSNNELFRILVHVFPTVLNQGDVSSTF